VCQGGFCICQPKCGVNACGQDGCGGSCGSCPPARTCSTATCVCIGDPNEPNDGCPQSKATLPGTYEGLVLCPAGEEDWFAFQLSAGQKLTVQALFKHNDADLDMFLYDKGNCTSYLKSSTSSTDNEAIVFTAAQGSTYAVRVVEFGGTAEAVYTLKATIE